MFAIPLYVVLKYLAITPPLTSLIFTKTSKKWRFLTFFVQSCPVSGKYRPDGWSDGQFFYLKTYRTKFRFDPYTIHVYPISQFLKVRGRSDILTDRQTDRQTNILIILIYKDNNNNNDSNNEKIVDVMLQWTSIQTTYSEDILWYETKYDVCLTKELPDKTVVVTPNF